MNIKIRLAVFVWLLLLMGSLHAQHNKPLVDSAAILQAQQLKQTPQATTYFSNHPDAQWFPKAGLGLFIHWGMTAVTGTGDLSWNMLANKPWKDATITPNTYYALANQWNPAKMNFDKMLKAAKAAGITYAVFVTKHHDGFTLWPSKYGEIGTKFKFGGRDFVKEFVTACRKYKIRVGLYYSPPDWYFERQYKNFSFHNKVQLDMEHNPTVLPKRLPASVPITDSLFRFIHFAISFQALSACSGTSPEAFGPTLASRLPPHARSFTNSVITSGAVSQPAFSAYDHLLLGHAVSHVSNHPSKRFLGSAPSLSP